MPRELPKPTEAAIRDDLQAELGLSQPFGLALLAEVERLRERVAVAEARVIEMVEQTDTIPGSDFRKQMAFNEKRYKGACKRADEAKDEVRRLKALVPVAPVPKKCEHCGCRLAVYLGDLEEHVGNCPNIPF